MYDTVQGYQYVYARYLVRAMQTGEFRVCSTETYQNEYRQTGIECTCEFRGRRFYLSENNTDQPSTVPRLIKVLKNENGFDRAKPLIWPNRRGEECLYLEVWDVNWYKFHTPTKNSPDDEFSKLIVKVLAELSKSSRLSVFFSE